MPSKVIAIRAPEDDWKAWDEAAKAENKSRNNWIRYTLNDSIRLSRALSGSQGDQKKRQAEKKINRTKSEAYPQEAVRCPHRLMPGTFCKKCGVTR